jgi:hypothetical protein
VWSDTGTAERRDEKIQTVLKKHKLAASDLTRSERAKALKQFRSGTGWHRADAMDQLSEEEADIIARRLLRRVQAKTPLPESKAATLKSSLISTLKERFVGSQARASGTPEQARDEFLEKTASYLNEVELAALRQAFASGLRPLPGEQ